MNACAPFIMHRLMKSTAFFSVFAVKNALPTVFSHIAHCTFRVLLAALF